MNPSQMFCPHAQCLMHGLLGQKNIVIHSQKEQRYRCLVCGHTFAATKGTPFYRLRTEAAVVTLVVTLLAHGCPRPAIVAAFGLDERTVAAWQTRAGQHCEQVHRATVRTGQVDLEHVQADELWVKTVGRKLWLALALAVPSRLWLGGVVSATRDLTLIRSLVAQVRRCACRRDILVCVDGLVSYVRAFCQAFKTTLPTGQRGGQPKQLPAQFLLGQVIKRRSAQGLTVERRAVVGTLAQIETRLRATGGGQVLNTAFIERLNATVRNRLAPLCRRGRCLVRKERTLHHAIYLWGTIYNFCCFHDSLRQETPEGCPGAARTPAMAAGLTAHRWTVSELLHYRIAGRPPRWDRRRTPPRWKLRPHRVVSLPSTV